MGVKRTRETMVDRFAACFEGLEDPRSGNAALHDFHTLLIIALCMVLCGGQGGVDMALFAEAKEPFLRDFLDMRNSPPSTALAVFSFPQVLSAFCLSDMKSVSY